MKKHKQSHSQRIGGRQFMKADIDESQREVVFKKHQFFFLQVEAGL
jgi:hypothetical protein